MFQPLANALPDPEVCTSLAGLFGSYLSGSILKLNWFKQVKRNFKPKLKVFTESPPESFPGMSRSNIQTLLAARSRFCYFCTPNFRIAVPPRRV